MLPKKGWYYESRSEYEKSNAIKNGTVIDHVPAGKALSVLKMLGIEGDMSNPVSLVMNVPSKKMGGKDIIKVEDRELTQNELDRLALVLQTHLLQLFVLIRLQRN